MDSSISLKKLKATAKLKKLIMQKASYERIVKQSKILDNYVQIQFEQKKKAS